MILVACCGDVKGGKCFMGGGLAASRFSILKALSILSGQLIIAANGYLESSP